MYHSPDFRPVVLVVDDCRVIQSLIKKVLEKQYYVCFADNGLEALSLIYTEHVTLMLLDVQMPGISGLEVCRAVRNIPRFVDLPIVMLTSCDQNFDKVQGKLAGATEYLTKPFKAAELLRVVAAHLQSTDIQRGPAQELERIKGIKYL